MELYPVQIPWADTLKSLNWPYTEPSTLRNSFQLPHCPPLCISLYVFPPPTLLASFVLVWSWHPPRFRLWPLFSCVCVFQYFACKAHDVSQHLLSSSEVNTDRGSNWAGKQRLYSGAVMCISLACLEMQTYTCLYCGHLSQRRLSGQQATPSLHVGENSWKAHAHTHLLDLDWCDRDGSLWLVIRGNHQSSDSPCAQKCVWDERGCSVLERRGWDLHACVRVCVMVVAIKTLEVTRFF